MTTRKSNSLGKAFKTVLTTQVRKVGENMKKPADRKAAEDSRTWARAFRALEMGTEHVANKTRTTSQALRIVAGGLDTIAKNLKTMETAYEESANTDDAQNAGSEDTGLDRGPFFIVFQPEDRFRGMPEEGWNKDRTPLYVFGPFTTRDKAMERLETGVLGHWMNDHGKVEAALFLDGEPSRVNDIRTWELLEDDLQSDQNPDWSYATKLDDPLPSVLTFRIADDDGPDLPAEQSPTRTERRTAAKARRADTRQ